ncbi:MAG TPA: hypothetical protein VL403_00675 [Candidatus Kryptonia bacterium]|nr:hypothetical protein [Candidatus Kryptonia bacterium]
MQVRRVLMMGLVLGWGAAAHAGWIIEQNNIATRPKGDPGPVEPATMRVSQGRVRLTQPNVVTVQDCVKGRFVMYIPERNVYWSGTIDEYSSELRAQAAQSATTASGNPAPTRGPEKLPTVNAASLPKLVVRKTDEQAKLAGYDATKYVIESDGSLFQEVWLTTAFNINEDLDPKKYVACQAKISAGMLGASAGSFNALYRSPDYLNLVSSGVILKKVTHHIAGTYTEEVRSISRADIADNEFDTPSGATRVSLNDLFAPVQR